MIEYIQRSRDYYAAQGYAPYHWAQFDDVPFTKPTKPLAESNLVLLTTAAPVKAEVGDQGPGAKYNAEAKFYDVFSAPIEPAPDLRISHIGYDRVHCRAEDPRTWLPIEALVAAQKSGKIGELSDELIGIPTNRSQRATLETDAIAALEHVIRVGADVALLVPT
jgi:D-proline reductase (dithiol) PrdB